MAPTEGPAEQLAALVAQVKSGAKYGAVCDQLVRNIGLRELASRHNLRAAVQATRAKLHQVGAAYMPARAQYALWLRTLREVSADPTALRAACRAVLAQHASTRERLPILESFFQRTLGDLAPVQSIADLACGFGPLAAAWMPLAQGASYLACDIYADLTAFLAGALPLLGVAAHTECYDVTAELPAWPRADVALLLKAIPCLEQLDKSCAMRLLRDAPARFVLVSFPVHSLGGAERRMRENYAAHLRELISDAGWPCQRQDFECELAFLLDKSAAP